MSEKEIIAKRIAKEIKEGNVVNLGIGLPTLVANYIPPHLDITLHSENGFLGLDKVAEESQINSSIVNAGAQPVTIKKDAVFFDSAMSFALVRGGHIDITVLGGLEVDEKGNLANYMVPGKIVPGMGGAMDLVCGAKKVIIGMTHTSKNAPKILKACTLPLTGKAVVNMIVTELAVFEMTDAGLVLKEIHEETTVEHVLSITEATVIVAEDVAKF